MADAALFCPTGAGRFEPTEAATGPWDPALVHGAAIAALLAGQLDPAEGTLARLTVEILGPVPMEPLELLVTEPAGGSRVRRQEAELRAGGRPVATAHSVTVRRTRLDLPEKALRTRSPFDPAAAPPLDEPNRAAAGIVGHESLDSCGLVWVPTRVEGDARTHQWVRLLLPVVEGTELRGVELAAAAADYGQAAVHRRLAMADWSFRNAELTLHMAREPVGPWIGMRCDALVQPVGAGFNTSDLFDPAGWVGTSTAAIVVEPRA